MEALLNKPFLVIDILPEQVPEDCAARYFAVEKYFLQEPVITDIRRRFADVLLKLNCYYPFRAVFPDTEQSFTDPAPELLASWIIREQKDLCILLAEEDVLITLSHDDTWMTVYNPSGAVLERIRPLVSANGLFLRQPEEEA